MICYSVLSLVPDFLLDANENVYILLALQNKLIDFLFSLFVIRSSANYR